MKAKKWIYAILVLLIIACGLFTRTTFAYMRFPHVVLKITGDALWATMFYLLFELLFYRKSYLFVFYITIAFAWMIEFSQLLQSAWIQSLRQTPLRYLIGQGFHYQDLFAYVIGAILGVALHKLTQRMLKKHKRCIR